MREQLVTRTFKTTKATVLMLDTVSCEPHNETVILPRTYKDVEAVLKATKKLVETEEDKVVKVVDVQEIEQLYGMSEVDFIKYAKELPARDSKKDEE